MFQSVIPEESFKLANLTFMGIKINFERLCQYDSYVTEVMHEKSDFKFE